MTPPSTTCITAVTYQSCLRYLPPGVVVVLNGPPVPYHLPTIPCGVPIPIIHSYLPSGCPTTTL